MQKIILLFTGFFLFAACEVGPTESSTEITSSLDQTVTGGSLESDIYLSLQEEFRSFDDRLPDFSDAENPAAIAQSIQNKRLHCTEQLSLYAFAAKQTEAQIASFCATLGENFMQDYEGVSANAAFVAIAPEDFAAGMRSSGAVVIDLRTEEERTAVGYLSGTDMHLDYYAEDFLENIKALPKETSYLLYCAHGNRSRTLRNSMEALGFSSVKDLEGGIAKWMQEGRAMEK